MTHLYQVSEWQGATGKWYCGDTNNLAAKYCQWMVPVRLLGMTPANYAEMLIKTFHADVSYSLESNFLHVSWKNQADMRKYKNFINQKARLANLLV